jgi:hypothetical protein
MKHKLKPLGTKRLKLEYDGLLLNFGFKFSLRRYTEVVAMTCTHAALKRSDFLRLGFKYDNLVGRCRLTLSNSR